MLRITPLPSTAGRTVFMLEGSVSGRWVNEIDRCCQEALAQRRSLTLDVGRVLFIDRSGLALFRNLTGRGITIVNCPQFLAEQLKAWGMTL